jgi:hypothetical protein
VIPTLVRFYGGSPVHWFRDVPLGMVRAHVRMLPRLRAAEESAACDAHGVAVHLKAGKWIEETIAGWNREMGGGRRQQRAKASPMAAAAAGLGRRPARKRVAPSD